MENQDNKNKGAMNNPILAKSKSKNVRKVDQQSEGRSSARWDAFMNLKFNELCEEEIGKGNRPNSHFNGNGWKNLVRRFNEVTGRNYVYKQLRNHWDSMKKDWILFKKLMNHETGIGWNPLKNSIEASDEWWERKLRENGEYNKFRNKDLSLIWFRYDKLFSDVAATGERARAPNQRLENEIDGEEEFFKNNGQSNQNEEHVEIGDSDNNDDICVDEYKTNLEMKEGDEAAKIVFPSFTAAKRKFSGESYKGKKKLSGAASLKDGIDFCHELNQRYGLQPTRGMSLYEEVGIFLVTCAHGVGNRLLQELFNHSGETISRHFHRVLKIVGKLANDIIAPHPEYNEGKGYHKPQHQRYIPFFKDCIGAIDGTHVKARLPQGKAIPYIGRKGYPTQNILAVVDFNMCFTFVWAGWEGVAHDNRIFGEAIRNPNLNFPIPKGRKYYLVDAGYSHTLGYMGPYRGDNIRYHLEDFRRARNRQLRAPTSLQEKFNYYHSSCRNIIERTFGVWKARWNILSDMPYYHIDTQREIVLATMAVHNYIRKKNVSDEAFQIAEDENYSGEKQSNEASTSASYAEEENNPSNAYWRALRDSLAMEIAGRG